MASSSSLEECFTLSDSTQCSIEMNKMYIPPPPPTTTTTTTTTSEIVITVQKMTYYDNQTELVIGKENVIYVDFSNSELVLHRETK